MLKQKPDLWRAGLAGKSENRGWFFLSSPRRPVNHLVLFRLAAINGIGVAGGWAERLAIWCPLVDMAAKVLRQVVEGRV